MISKKKRVTWERMTVMIREVIMLNNKNECHELSQFI